MTRTDLILLYTGGTPGLPKGVMWRQDDLLMLLGAATSGRYGEAQDLDFARTRVARPGRLHLPAAPLMLGAGCFTCIPFLARGGSVALLESTAFDPVELLDVVERCGVTSVSWVGEVFARPLLDVLRAQPDRWDLSSSRTITSGGMALPGVVLSDEEIREHVATRLGRYEAPRAVVRVDLVPRGPNGRPDLAEAKQFFARVEAR